MASRMCPRLSAIREQITSTVIQQAVYLCEKVLEEIKQRVEVKFLYAHFSTMQYTYVGCFSLLVLIINYNLFRSWFENGLILLIKCKGLSVIIRTYKFLIDTYTCTTYVHVLQTCKHLLLVSVSKIINCF